jgi:hypothetical protein
VVSGPTKSGKSVLCHKALGGRELLKIDGGQIRSIDDFWAHIAFNLQLPNTASRTSIRGTTLTGLFEFAFSLVTLLKSKFSGSAALNRQDSLTTSYTNVPAIASIRSLLSRETVLLLDDFHYLEKDVRRAILRSLKNAVSDGLKVVILAGPYRAFDPLEAEPELAGRVEHVELPSWAAEDLAEIPGRGFAALGLDVPSHVQRRIADDGFGNPLLVQDFCLALSRRVLEKKSPEARIGAEDLSAVYDSIVQGRGMGRFDRLQSWSGGAGRNVTVLLKGGVVEELPAAILRAVARLGPKPVTSLLEIRESLQALAEHIPAIEMIEPCLSDISFNAAKIGDSPLEWDSHRHVLEINDPHLMFYLRWVVSDRRTLNLPGRAMDRLIGVVQAQASDDADEQP